MVQWMMHYSRVHMGRADWVIIKEENVKLGRGRRLEILVGGKGTYL